MFLSPNYQNTGNPETDGDRQAFLREIICAGLAVDPVPGGKGIYDKIHRSRQVQSLRSNSCSKNVPCGRACRSQYSAG